MALSASEACGDEPADCDYSAVAVPASPTDLTIHRRVADRVKNNLRTIPGRGDLHVRIDSVTFNRESAFVAICAFDSAIVYDIGDPTNADDDIIFNDERNSYDVRWEMRQVNGRWILFEGVNLRTLKDGDLCGF